MNPSTASAPAASATGGSSLAEGWVAAPEVLFFENGATWYWLLAGPLSAAAMLTIQLKGGMGFQWFIPTVFLVLVTGSLVAVHPVLAITQTLATQVILVLHPSLAAASVRELVEHGRASPGRTSTRG